jgi:hypothetical protein
MTKPATGATIQLTYPLTVKAGDKPATRDAIEIARPKTRHVKRLAVLLGADLARLLTEDEGAANAMSSRELGIKVVTDLLTAGKLEELTAIVADLCGEEPALIDDLDVEDLLKLFAAFAGFFPSLTSLLSGGDQPS